LQLKKLTQKFSLKKITGPGVNNYREHVGSAISEMNPFFEQFKEIESKTRPPCGIYIRKTLAGMSHKCGLCPLRVSTDNPFLLHMAR